MSSEYIEEVSLFLGSLKGIAAKFQQGRNPSVFTLQDNIAVWNLRKAVYIAGNYTGKYILNSTIFCIFNFVVSFLVQVLFILGQISPTIPFIFVILHTVGVISYFIYIYCIYVDAYLLGTIAPPHEG